MAGYKLFIKPSAAKELEGIGNRKDRRRLVAKIRSLAKEPRPSGCQKLSGGDKYRVRQGRYRILYRIDDERQVIAVMKVAHRREAYRD